MGKGQSKKSSQRSQPQPSQSAQINFGKTQVPAKQAIDRKAVGRHTQRVNQENANQFLLEKMQRNLTPSLPPPQNGQLRGDILWPIILLVLLILGAIAVQGGQWFQ